MEAVERNCGVVEFQRYKRKRIPIPVLPPRIPSTVDLSKSGNKNKKNDLCSENANKESKIYKYKQKIQKQPKPSPKESAHFGDTNPNRIVSEFFDYSKDTTENDDGNNSFSFVDTKKEESYYAVTNALNASEENALPIASLPTDRAMNGAPFVEHNSLQDLVRVDGAAQIKNANYSYRTKSKSQHELSSSAKNDVKMCSSESTIAASSAVYVTRKTADPGALNSEFNKLTSALCDRSDCNDVILNNFDYRFRYGLSSLEICSKYSSRASELNNLLKARSYSVKGNDQITYQTSTAAAFFARASQKLKLNSSPHRRKRRGSGTDDGASKGIGGFSNLLHRSPPPVPSALLRKIGQREATGIGKVKVMLKVCSDIGSTSNEEVQQSAVFNMDKKRKQVTLYEPISANTHVDTPEERKLALSAPKMFAFDALFSEDDSQIEICGNALTDVIHAVINGNDGCIFCFGNSKLGKTKTMIGSSESTSTLGVIPCAIAWLYRAVNEQKQKTGARFSVRVSAIEISAVSQQFKDLLTDYASDTEQSPGVYLKDDPILGSNLQNRSELRAPLPEKAAFYLDAAQNERSTSEESHFLYTLHVYQYNVANKGAVAGGRSRLYLIDLAGNDRIKGSCSSASNIGNVLLAIFNGQKHLPNRDLKITQVLKECLSSLTCYAAMIAHVSPLAQHYHETLATVQLASRIHRIRRRKIKFIGVSNGINTTTDENGRLTSSSDFDPSSSEQSADTVIYVGPSDETDNEHPPVCIPSLNSADNRGLLGKVLRESEPSPSSDPYFVRASKIPALSKSVPASPQKLPRPENKIDAAAALAAQLCVAATRKHHIKSSSGFHSAHSSPIRNLAAAAGKTQDCKPLEERWIDGPRISKSKIVEARNVHMMKKDGQKNLTGKRETWIDGPMKNASQDIMYGFMDIHKRNMIKKWVENQSVQLQNFAPSKEECSEKKVQYKALTVFKTCDNDGTDESRGQGSGQEEDAECEKLKTNNQVISYNHLVENQDLCKKYNGDLPIQTCRSDENERMDSDDEIEIIEVEEPEEPVPMQDSCLQVTEEDIAFCMGELENPLPEVDQEEHPLRALSQENMTVVSTFTDSMSVVNDLDRLFPRSRYYFNNYNSPVQPSQNSSIFDRMKTDKDKTRSQLSKLHELYENKLDLNSCLMRHLNGDVVRAVSRCQSLTLSELCNSGENNLRNNNDFENSSIASEPAYIANTNTKENERLCENCKGSLTSMQFNTQRNNHWSHHDDLVLGKLQSYRHMKNIMNLRHPDGASNPNLQEMEGNKKLSNGTSKTENNSEEEDDESAIPLPLNSKLLTLSREGFDRRLFTKHCDSPEFANVTGNNKVCSSFKKAEQLVSQKGQYSRANVKKLQTYRVELKNNNKK